MNNTITVPPLPNNFSNSSLPIIKPFEQEGDVTRVENVSLPFIMYLTTATSMITSSSNDGPCYSHDCDDEKVCVPEQCFGCVGYRCEDPNMKYFCEQNGNRCSSCRAEESCPVDIGLFDDVDECNSYCEEKECPPDEELKSCGSGCEPTCTDNGEAICTTQCFEDVCQCRDGYVRVPSTFNGPGPCVLLEDCWQYMINSQNDTTCPNGDSPMEGKWCARGWQSQSDCGYGYYCHLEDNAQYGACCPQMDTQSSWYCNNGKECLFCEDKRCHNSMDGKGNKAYSSHGECLSDCDNGYYYFNNNRMTCERCHGNCIGQVASTYTDYQQCTNMEFGDVLGIASTARGMIDIIVAAIVVSVSKYFYAGL